MLSSVPKENFNKTYTSSMFNNINDSGPCLCDLNRRDRDGGRVQHLQQHDLDRHANVLPGAPCPQASGESVKDQCQKPFSGSVLPSALPLPIFLPVPIPLGGPQGALHPLVLQGVEGSPQQGHLHSLLLHLLHLSRHHPDH